MKLPKSLRLEPIRHPAPECAAYDDDGTVGAFERAMRVHRAHRERFKVTLLDDRVDGAYRVESPTGGTYYVDVVDRGGLHDGCTCPDFLGNGLGTCKHLEAVRRAVARNAALAAAFRRVPVRVKRPTIATESRSAPVPVALGRFSPGAKAKWIDADGPRASALRSAEAGAGAHGVRITHAALSASARIEARRERRERASALRRALDEGRLSVDVLTSPLFPYQRDGVEHLLRAGRALLADDMGLGKTVQTIAACEVLRLRGEARRILVVTNASLKAQWAKEIERYAGVRAAVISGRAAERAAAFQSDAPYAILNYELTWRDLSQLKGLSADVLVLDEAQRAKNFRTRTAATLRAIPSRHLFVLTGTPVENRLDDLYSLMQLIDPEVLGPLYRFNLDFHVQDEKGRVIGYRNMAELRARIEGVVLRRRKEEVLHQLPELTQQTRYVPMTEEQAELEASYRMDAAKILAVTRRRPLTPNEQKRLMAALLKARQACDAAGLCDPALRSKRSPKLEEMASLVSEITAQGGAKILIFSEWTEMLKLAGEVLDSLHVGYRMLHGGVPSAKRAALLDGFREDPGCAVLLCTEAGGVGLNLQVASYVIHLDLPWNPARIDQRNGRAHRVGQTRGVSVTYLCAESGIERGIERTLDGKRAVRSAAIDAASTVDELPAPSFSIFVAELEEIFDHVDVTGDGVSEDAGPEAPPVVAIVDALAPEMRSASTAPMAPADPAPAEPKPLKRARRPAPDERLRLARVVLDAGFSADALKAAYQALAGSFEELLAEPPEGGHAGLVAAVYRELSPAGRAPVGALSTLSLLHDLARLDEHGVEVDAESAKAAVDDAERWIRRFTAAASPAG
jgi:superfamily II DNA or RNA helicase